jgi:uncharacterized protein
MNVDTTFTRMVFVVVSLLRSVLWIVLLLVALVFTIPFALAFVAVLQQQFRPRTFTASALYAGRVWHTRFRPMRHAFTYPFIIFGVHFDDIYPSSGRNFASLLWPLSWIVTFNSCDHLKNGEGIRETKSNTLSKHPDALTDRIFQLISERTHRTFVPNVTTHSIFLLTQLTYYGYCFNPVSFYFVHNRETQRIEAVIGEVSNTPWNEMHCYVLHPNSIDDQVAVVEETSTDMQTVHYTFPKRFHVSPFMEMSYNYEWTFTNFSIPNHGDSDESAKKNPTAPKSHHQIRVINSLRPLSSPSQLTQEKPELQFTARMQVDRYSMHPFRIAYTLSLFPMYCMLVQIWIHIQAFLLFCKGVAYQPHPTGAETWASRMIGTAMVPLFALQDQYQKLSATTSKIKKRTLPSQKQKAT